MLLEEPTIFEQSAPGRIGYSLPASDVPPPKGLPAGLRRKRAAELPELSEADVVRHFVRLSSTNFNKDAGFYPLGSCTMKYNPKVCEVAAAGFSRVHPYQPVDTVQDCLELIYELEGYLAEIGGFHAVSLWPAAGAHGELTGMLMIRAYHKGRPRKKVIIPASAHGTNPASTAIAGYEVVEIKSDKDGVCSPDTVAKVMDEDVAAIMLTNPNTLGLFEPHIKEIAKIVHGKGGLVYMDGANLNALMGIWRPGDSGVDAMHFNLHKTFATPHGGGGPGSGPVGVSKVLEPFLPIPRVVKIPPSPPLVKGGEGGLFSLSESFPHSIGRIRAFYGNFAVMVKAYAYIREMGAEGLKKASELAVLNAAYIRARLEGHYYLPYKSASLHECVFSDKIQNEYGVKTLDIAKRLMDYGFHPPTIYFPLIVPGAIMIEPTETENKAACDGFVDAMIKIAEECKTNPDVVKTAPHTTFRRRLDEVKAAKELKLKAVSAKGGSASGGSGY